VVPAPDRGDAVTSASAALDAGRRGGALASWLLPSASRQGCRPGSLRLRCPGARGRRRNETHWPRRLHNCPERHGGKTWCSLLFRRVRQDPGSGAALGGGRRSGGFQEVATHSSRPDPRPACLTAASRMGITPRRSCLIHDQWPMRHGELGRTTPHLVRRHRGRQVPSSMISPTRKPAHHVSADGNQER